MLSFISLPELASLGVTVVAVPPSAMLSDETRPSVVIGSVVMTSFSVVTSAVDTVLGAVVKRVDKGKGPSGAIFVISVESGKTYDL